MDAIEQFKGAMRAHGLTPPEIIADGKLHRFSTNGKRGDDSGWYVFHDDGIPAGAFGDWRTDIKRSWRADIGRTLTPAEEAAHQRKVDAMRRAREAEEARRKAEAREKAAAIWEAAIPAASDHPYLARKRVSPVASLREIGESAVVAILGYAPQSRDKPLAGRLLVVPVKVGDELSTVEFIDDLGRKSALYGGAKKGGYWAAQPLPNGDGAGLTLLLGEGVATSLSAREATGHLAVASLYSGNLPAVASAMHERYPKAVLVVLADLVRDTGLPDPHACEAAHSVGGPLVLPDFGEDRNPAWTDLNDMCQHRGREAVRRAIASAVAEPGLTDLGNAHRFARDHGGWIRYCWPWAKWLIWNGRYWCRDETGEIHRLAEVTVRAMYETAGRSSSQERREALGGWAVKCESHERRAKMLASAQAIEGIPVRPEDWIGIHGC